MVSPPPSDEAAWMRRVAEGDKDAFRALYERHATSVMSLLFHLCHDRGLAEDLTQETFVRAWRAARRWQPRSSVRAWLLTIARRRGWDEGRRRRRQALLALSTPEIDVAGRAEDPVEGAGLHEEAARAKAAVLTLSPRLRLAFVLVRMEGLSLEEAARVAGVPVGTVKSRVHAAETALRERLGGTA